MHVYKADCAIYLYLHFQQFKHFNAICSDINIIIHILIYKLNEIYGILEIVWQIYIIQNETRTEVKIFKVKVGLWFKSP